MNGFSLCVQPGQLLGIHEGGGVGENKKRPDGKTATVGQIMWFSGLSLVLNKAGL